jgi:hypothetical protein
MELSWLAEAGVRASRVEEAAISTNLEASPLSGDQVEIIQNI